MLACLAGEVANFPGIITMIFAMHPTPVSVDHIPHRDDLLIPALCNKDMAISTWIANLSGHHSL